MNDTNNTVTIWPEKYRPTELASYLGNPVLIDSVKKYITNNDVPHLLYYGTPGTGKTSLAKLIANTLKCDYLYINASDENNVENIRTKVKDFASTTGFSDLKIIILDEADYLTHNSQAALRNIMETYVASTRFILTCNYLEKISDALTSRCQCTNVTPMSKKDVAILLKNILTAENVKYTMEDLGYIVNTYYPDIRKVLNFAQQSVVDNTIQITELQSALSDVKNNIIELLKTKQDTNKTFAAIRQLVADSGIRHYEELYQHLFDKVDAYTTSPSVAIIIVAEYLYQSAMVVNKELMFMACIAKLLEAVN